MPHVLEKNSVINSIFSFFKSLNYSLLFLKLTIIGYIGHRCYREYPPHWIERQLERGNMILLDTSKYDILYSHKAMVRQLNVARSKLPLFPNKDLANEMGKTIDALDKESGELILQSPNQRLRLGFDYVITAEKKKTTDTNIK